MDKNEYLNNTKFLRIPVTWFRLTEPPFNLNYGELILLSRIFDLSFNDDQRSYCWSSNQSLADYLKTSKDTVKRYLRHLEELKLITREFVRAECGLELRLSVINLDKILEYCPNMQ